MGHLRLLLFALWCVGEARIGSAESEDNPLKNLPEIAPSITLNEAPRSRLPAQPAHRTGFKGRLLPAKDGRGASKSGIARIVGGTKTKPGTYSWMALIRYLSGTTITFNCGEHNTNLRKDPSRDDIRIGRSTPHAQYDNNLMINDIALLHLTRDVTFTERIKPICVPTDPNLRYQSFVGQNPFVSGWSYATENSGQSSILKHVQVPVIPNRDCAQLYAAAGAYKSPAQFGYNVLCAEHTYGGRDACKGDSGGPLMLPISDRGVFSFYQISVVSYGIGCARPYIPGVYTNVVHYANWIQQNLL